MPGPPVVNAHRVQYASYDKLRACSYGINHVGALVASVGLYWAVSPTLNPGQGSVVPKTRSWPYVGPCGPSRKSEGPVLR